MVLHLLEWGQCNRPNCSIGDRLRWDRAPMPRAPCETSAKSCWAGTVRLLAIYPACGIGSPIRRTDKTPSGTSASTMSCAMDWWNTAPEALHCSRHSAVWPLSRRISFDCVDRSRTLAHLIWCIWPRRDGICKNPMSFYLKTACFFFFRIRRNESYRFGMILMPVSLPLLLCAFAWAATFGMFGDALSK